MDLSRLVNAPPAGFSSPPFSRDFGLFIPRLTLGCGNGNSVPEKKIEISFLVAKFGKNTLKIWSKKKLKEIFSNLSCSFLNPNYFLIWIIVVQMFEIWKISSNKFKKHSISKIVLTFHCSNKLFLCSKKKSRSLEQFFLTVGQNNFGNKILLWIIMIDRLEFLPQSQSDKWRELTHFFGKID